MATAAQTKANRENAKKSQGPTSDAGKEASSRNNLRHGLTGHVFVLMSWEDSEAFDDLQNALRAEHKPTTPTEAILVEKMAQHHWFSQRAQTLLTSDMSVESRNADMEEALHKSISTYLRYQNQHDRAFQRALNDLLKLRAEKRKEQIGFESQKRVEAEESRKQAAETRKSEQHQITMDIKKQRFEREKSNAIIAGLKAGDQMSKILPPNWEELLNAA